MSSRGKRLVTGCLTLLMLVLFSAPARSDGGPFRVGVIAPLSGPLAEYGIASRNGIETAKSARPDLFKNVEFVYEDSQWDAKTSVSAFNRLRAEPGVSLVYNWGNPTSEAVAPLAEQYKVPLIALTLDPRIASGKKFVIRATNEADAFSGALADYLRERGYKKIGIVLSENTYVQGLFEGLKKRLSKDQTIDVVSSFNISEHDFRSSITKLRSRNYDAVGVFLISGQVSEFYRQLQDQHVAFPTFGTDFFESSTEISLAKGGMEGAVYPHLGAAEDFRKRYVKTYGNDYQVAYAGNAYDMAMLIGTLFGGPAAPRHPEKIMEALKSSGIHSGVCGPFLYADTSSGGPHYSYPVRLKVIRGGAIHLVNEPAAIASSQ